MSPESRDSLPLPKRSIHGTFRILAIRGRRHTWLLGGIRPIVGIGLFLVLLAAGCGVRQSNTGSLQGRVMNLRGDVVQGATVYSIWDELEKSVSGKDGIFYLPELPVGLNRIVVTHPQYRLEERSIEVLPNKNVMIDALTLDWPASQSEVISETAIDEVTSSSAVITWKTYKEAKCRIEWGETRGYGKSEDEITSFLSHRFMITGLAPESVYHARVGFFDESSIFRYSVDVPFKTLNPDQPRAPATARATPTGYGVIKVEWDKASGSTAVAYRVSRREPDQDWTKLSFADLDGKTLSLEDTSVVGGHFYEYMVTSVANDTTSSSGSFSNRVFMPGYISETLRFTASQSPILLISDLIVAPGASLIAEPGVEFRVSSSDSFRIGKDPDRVEIILQGYSQMIGDALHPVRFTPMNGSGGRKHWGGLRYQNGKTGNSELGFVEIAGCNNQAVAVEGTQVFLHDLVISYSDGGLLLSKISFLPTIENIRFEDLASAAIVIEDCRYLKIASCTMNAVQTGIVNALSSDTTVFRLESVDMKVRGDGIVGSFMNAIIKNCLILAPNGTGMRFTNVLGEKTYFDHCTIDALNGVDIALGRPFVENCVLVNLSQVGQIGIRYQPGGLPDMLYNDVFGFAIPYQGCVASAGSIAIQPDFLNKNPPTYQIKDGTLLKNADRYGSEMGKYGISYY